MTNYLKTIIFVFLYKLYFFNKISNCKLIPGLDSPVDIFNTYFE